MSKTLLAIDPGDKESGYALIEIATRRPIEVGKIDNERLLDKLRFAGWGDHSGSVDPFVVAIEMISSYGMAVGKEVFDTCVWIGRFYETISRSAPTNLVFRRIVKLHHCQSTAAKDPNITRALVDRFTPGQPNFGKGTKANPGWFYGFGKDIWQAYALAVQQADVLEGYQP